MRRCYIVQRDARAAYSARNCDVPSWRGAKRVEKCLCARNRPGGLQKHQSTESRCRAPRCLSCHVDRTTRPERAWVIRRLRNHHDEPAQRISFPITTGYANGHSTQPDDGRSLPYQQRFQPCSQDRKLDHRELARALRAARANIFLEIPSGSFGADFNWPSAFAYVVPICAWFCPLQPRWCGRSRHRCRPTQCGRKAARTELQRPVTGTF